MGESKRLILPSNKTLIQQFMQFHHNTTWSGHPGRDKMFQKMKRQYFWPGMYNDIAQYTNDCKICQAAKSRNRRNNGLLRPLPIPQGPWEQVTMDYVIGLPESKKR